MSKSLIIAEKPSVANDIARALGGFKKEGDHFENERYIISSALGHLVELALPSELDVKRGKWSFANLPIIPDEFELRPIEKTKTRFNMLKKLMKRDDVDLLISGQAQRRQKADSPLVVAIDDNGFDPRGVQSFAFRGGDGPALKGSGL